MKTSVSPFPLQKHSCTDLVSIIVVCCNEEIATQDILSPAEQAEFKALQAKHPDWMPAQGLDTPATVRSVAENAAARAEFTGGGHHRQPLKFRGEPNPPDLVPTGETRTVKNPIHTEVTNWWNKVLRRINSE